MSRDELHQTAQADTPPHVDIPNTPHGLVLWLLGRFGVAVVFAASTYYVYQDMRSDRAEVMDAYRENIRVIGEFRTALDAQTRELAEIRRFQSPRK